jgi:hypothetical protein
LYRGFWAFGIDKSRVLLGDVQKESGILGVFYNRKKGGNLVGKGLDCKPFRKSEVVEKGWYFGNP